MPRLAADPFLEPRRDDAAGRGLPSQREIAPFNMGFLIPGRAARHNATHLEQDVARLFHVFRIAGVAQRPVQRTGTIRIEVGDIHHLATASAGGIPAKATGIGKRGQTGGRRIIAPPELPPPEPPPHPDSNAAITARKRMECRTLIPFDIAISSVVILSRAVK